MDDGERYFDEFMVVIGLQQFVARGYAIAGKGSSRRMPGIYSRLWSEPL